MATYSFKCEACETIADFSMSMNDTKPEMELPCETCGSDTKQTKVIQPSGIVLKGSGWTGKIG